MTDLSIDETHHHHDLYSSIGSSITMIVLLTVTFQFTMTVLSIDEIHHHHDLYSSIGSSVTMIVLLITTALFMLAFL